MTPGPHDADRRSAPSGLIGMVHLLPLPGSPRWTGSMASVLDRATADAVALADGGIRAILVENYGDVPFFRDRVPPETVAAMTRAIAAVRKSVELPVGVNVLRNDVRSAIAIAAATGAAFVRVNVHVGEMVTDQGRIRGRAAATLRLRERLAPEVAILADVLVKHAAPPPGWALEDAARDTWHRGLADALVVSGAATGAETDLEEVRRVREAVPRAPVLVGSGITVASVRSALESSDGAIVGSALQEGGVAGSPVDPRRVQELVAAAR